MKLHKVTIHNLNSLYGENVIDFDRDLERAALFLIVGPTGAGKSTILDAICLALFGQTPRLSRTNGKPDTDPALVMSYGTGRCSAIVEFSLRDPETGDRRRYRATWDCRRAREKPTGNVQTPERSLHRIHEDGAEELLISDSRQKYFGEVFDGVLQGLTVQDFQRSVLLAQGEFAAFLKADEGVKANILERLTNTDTYRRIGQRAARKRQLLSDQLKAHQARLDGLSLLSEAEEQALPLPSYSVDRVLLVHALESAEQIRPLLHLSGAAFCMFHLQRHHPEPSRSSRRRRQNRRPGAGRAFDEGVLIRMFIRLRRAWP